MIFCVNLGGADRFVEAVTPQAAMSLVIKQHNKNGRKIKPLLSTFTSYSSDLPTSYKNESSMACSEHGRAFRIFASELNISK